MRKRNTDEPPRGGMIGKGPLMTPEPKAPIPASSLQDRATSDLRYIRSTMERAGSFTSVSGMGMMFVGGIGCAAWWWGRGLRFDLDAPSLLAIWLSSAFAAVVVSGWAIRKKADETRQSLRSGPARTFVIAFVPSILAGAVLTVFFFERDQTGWLPGTWLTLYGAAVAAGGATSVKPVPLMGALFMLLGVAAFMSPGRAQLLLLAGFGVLHLLFGFLLYKRYGG
jgi:hypothetical protein